MTSTTFVCICSPDPNMSPLSSLLLVCGRSQGAHHGMEAPLGRAGTSQLPKWLHGYLTRDIFFPFFFGWFWKQESYVQVGFLPRNRRVGVLQKTWQNEVKAGLLEINSLWTACWMWPTYTMVNPAAGFTTFGGWSYVPRSKVGYQYLGTVINLLRLLRWSCIPMIMIPIMEFWNGWPSYIYIYTYWYVYIYI